jgi:hypothetical protein
LALTGSAVASVSCCARAAELLAGGRRNAVRRPLSAPAGLWRYVSSSPERTTSYYFVVRST